MTLRTISYGGGVQSTALVILAARRDERLAEIMGGQVDAAVMANVGDDSEHPDAIRWVRDVVKPWADQQRFMIAEVARTKRDGSQPTLLQDVLREDTRTINIPVRMQNGAPGNRNCTSEWKIKVLAKWHKEHGATEADPAIVAVGISTDEIERVNTRRRNPHERVVYPLVELGMDRSACQRLNVETFGRPAPKSSCWFCPFHKPQRFAEMRRDEPELFAQAVELERTINRKRDKLGKDHVYLTRFAKPLDQAITEAQTPLFTDATWSDPGEAGCDSGACFT